MHALTLLNNFPYVPSTFTVLRRASSVADEVRWCGVLSFFLPTRSPDACLHACAWSAERAACAGLDRSQVGETLSPSHPSAYLAAWLPYAYTRADCQYVHSIIVPHAAPASAPPIPTTLFLAFSILLYLFSAQSMITFKGTKNSLLKYSHYTPRKRAPDLSL